MANIRRRKHDVPCPTCSKGQLYWTDQIVCRQCESDIERGRKARETEDDESGEHIRIQLGNGFQYSNHLPDRLKDPFFEHRNDDTGNHIFPPISQLILSITGQPVDYASGRDVENSIYPMEGSSRSAVVTPNQAKNIQLLADLIGGLLYKAEQDGFRRGSGLLRGLADGSKSVKDFEDSLAKRGM